jgi:hypothetical protein
MNDISDLRSIIPWMRSQLKFFQALVKAARQMEKGRTDYLEKELQVWGNQFSQFLMQTVLNATLPKVPHSTRPCACGKKTRFVQERKQNVTTMLGVVQVRRTYFQCRHCKGTEAPEDHLYGLDIGHFTRAAQSAIVEEGVTASSFKLAAKNLRKRNVRVSEETVRTLTEATGRRWAKQVDQRGYPAMKAPDPDKMQFYASADGVKVNTTEGFRELRVGVIYPQDQSVKCYVAHMGELGPLGNLMRKAAAAMGIRRCEQLRGIGDGAPWVIGLFMAVFAGIRYILDFYHAAEHIHDCAEKVFGKDKPQTKAWFKRRRHTLRHVGGAALCKELKTERAALPRRKRGEIDKLLGYLQPRLEQTKYPSFRRQKLHIGSGTVECGCKIVSTMRLKGPGMRWHPDNVTPMAALRGAWLSNQWEAVEDLMRTS